MKSILLTGGTGQLGKALIELDWGGDLGICAPTRAELDLTSQDAVREAFADHAFAAVINAAAYTGVDRAESEVGAAFAANALGPALLAEVTAEAKIPLLHISTDFVFAGDKHAPYDESDAPAPLNVYGASKLAGELAVRAGNQRSIVLRTAWLQSTRGPNFLHTMRRLARSGSPITVVDDQRGSPTAAGDLAKAVQLVVGRQLADTDTPAGIYHFVNAGEASWCELANVILTLSAPPFGRVSARPIPSADYPAPARRPANSRLSTAKFETDFGLKPRPWREAIAEIIASLDAQPASSDRDKGVGA